MMIRMAWVCSRALAVMVAAGIPFYLAFPTAAAALEVAANKQAVELACQPLAVPSGTIPLVMAHDGLLREELARQGLTLRLHPFAKGPEVNQNLATLDAAFAGDMPTIKAAAEQGVTVVGLARMSHASLVAKTPWTVAELKGKTVAYAPGTSGHHMLLHALDGAGIAPGQVTLTPMEVNEMPAALAQGGVDAFAAWEPTPVMALAKHPEWVVIHRGLFYSYFYLTPGFREHPAAAPVMAAFVRAIRWLKSGPEPLERACRWNQEEAQRFLGKPWSLSLEQCAFLVRRDLLDPAPQGRLPRALLAANGLVAQQTVFLREQGELKREVTPARVLAAFDPRPLERVLSDGEGYQLSRFSYD